MSQNSLVIPTTGVLSGIQLVLDLNAALSSLATQNAGSTPPANPVQWQSWFDTATEQLFFYNGTTWVRATYGMAFSSTQVISGAIPIDQSVFGSVLEVQGTSSVTLGLPVPSDFANYNVGIFNALSSGSTLTVTTSGGAFVGQGVSGTSLDIPPGVLALFLSDGFDWLVGSTIGNALLNGSASEVFNCATAVEPTQAVPLGQAQGAFASINGSTSEIFAVEDAPSAAYAPNLGQAESLFGQLATENTWSQAQFLSGGATVLPLSGAFSAGSIPTGNPSWLAANFAATYAALVEAFYSGGTLVFSLDSQGNVSLKNINATTGSFSGPLSVQPAQSGAQPLQIAQVENSSLTVAFSAISAATASLSAIVAGSVSATGLISGGTLAAQTANAQQGVFPTLTSSTSSLGNASLSSETLSGTLIQTPGSGSSNQSPLLQMGDIFSSGVISGFALSTSTTSFSATTSGGIAYVNGQRIVPATTTTVAPSGVTSYIDVDWYGNIHSSTNATPGTNDLRLYSVTAGSSGITGSAQLWTYPDLEILDNLIAAGSITAGTSITAATSATAAEFYATNSSSLTGATSGTVASSMPFQGVYKKWAAYVNGYINDTTTNQSLTFPTAFTNTPVVTTNTTGLTVSVTTTALTITSPDSTTAYSGLLIVEGL